MKAKPNMLELLRDVRSYAADSVDALCENDLPSGAHCGCYWHRAERAVDHGIASGEADDVRAGLEAVQPVVEEFAETWCDGTLEPDEGACTPETPCVIHRDIALLKAAIGEMRHRQPV